MRTRKNRKKKPVAVQAAELSAAVPAVIARRLERIALAGARPTARDRKEFRRMGSEKVLAFCESCHQALKQTLRIQRTIAADLVRAAGSPRPPFILARTLSPAALSRHSFGILGKGLAPVHRRAVANAKRLRRKRSR